MPAVHPEEMVHKKKTDFDARSDHSVTSCRSTHGHSTRLIHYLKPTAGPKDFHEPATAFQPDKEALTAFLQERFIQGKHDIWAFATGRKWGVATGPGIGTFLMATAWACQLFIVLALSAVPFWIMITTTSGFYGSYSVELGTQERGIPYMQPYSFNNQHSDPSFLPALNFASILEDKGDKDLTSRMKFVGTEYLLGLDMGRDHFLFIVGLFDVLAILFLLYSRRHFKLTVEKYQSEYDEQVLEIADYTVLVTGLPKDISPSDADAALLEYFNSRYASYQEETGSSPVAEVYPITTEGELVEMLKKRRKLEVNVMRLLAKQVSTGKDLSKKIEKAKAKHEDMEAQVAAKATDASIHKLRGAFVVFNEAKLADEAVASAPCGWLQRLVVPRASRLRGKHILTIEAATAPSNYIYENLAISPLSRSTRVAISNSIVFLLLIAALALVIILKTYQNTLLAQLNMDQGIIQRVVAQRAPSVLPASAAATGDVAAWEAAMASECSGVLPQCPATALNPFSNGVNVTMAYGAYLEVEPQALQSYYTNNFLRSMTDCVTNEAACNAAVPAETQVACLTCYCQGIRDAEARGTLPFNFFQASVAKAKCRPYLAFDAAGAGINAAIAVLLAAVNVVLGAVIRTLTLFERHRSHTEEHASLCWKTTIAQFLNTSITPLVASAEIRWLAVVFGGVVFESGYPDFTTNWYATAGTQVVIILLTTSLTQRAVGWVTGAVVPAVIRRVGRPYTQEQLHEMHMNAGFHLGNAFAEVSLVTMQALTFGAGIPVMYVIAAAAMLINTVDTKVKLRYVWPLPRRFGMKCTYMYLSIVKAMTYLHTLFAVWMLSYFRMHGQIANLDVAEKAALSSGADGSSESFVTWFRYERIFQVATWGHCALLLGFVLREAVPATLGSVLKILKLAAGLRPSAQDLVPVDADMPFMDAIQTGTMRGMTSYNVAHVEKAVLFDDKDLAAVASVNDGLAPFPAAAAALAGVPVPPTEGAMALKSALEDERHSPEVEIGVLAGAARAGVGTGSAAQHSGSGRGADADTSEGSEEEGEEDEESDESSLER
eukprot:jgi/Ulvmu1/6841/UM031_0046.1